MKNNHIVIEQGETLYITMEGENNEPAQIIIQNTQDSKDVEFSSNVSGHCILDTLFKEEKIDEFTDLTVGKNIINEFGELTLLSPESVNTLDIINIARDNNVTLSTIDFIEGMVMLLNKDNTTFFEGHVADLLNQFKKRKEI